MKTKEFIELLKKEDPEGTAEVVVDGIPVYYVERLPGYYDGPYAVLIQDKNKQNCYNVLGIKHTREGMKLKIGTLSTEQILDDDPDAIVELHESLGPVRIEAMTKGIAEMREESRAVIKKVEEWRKNKGQSNE